MFSGKVPSLEETTCSKEQKRVIVSCQVPIPEVMTLEKAGTVGDIEVYGPPRAPTQMPPFSTSAVRSTSNANRRV